MMPFSPATLIAQPDILPESDTWYWVSGPGACLPLTATRECVFGIFEFHRPGELILRADRNIGEVQVRPVIRETAFQVEQNEIRIEIREAGNLCVEAPGLPAVFLYIHDRDIEVPEPGGGGKLLRIEQGTVHHGDLILSSGDVLYLETGSVLKGSVHVWDAENVHIAGRGVICGEGFHRSSRLPNLLLFENCKAVRVEGVTLIEPSSWMLVCALCEHVHIRDLKEIGEKMCSDGIDVVASKNVLIEDCCLRNNDDCIVIKAKPHKENLHRKHTWTGNVEKVHARNCLLYNAQCGNALEIGFELNGSYVRDVVFEEIDILGAHGAGNGVFTIHNGDQASVEDVVYRNIRVEQFYDRLVDFGIYPSRYSTSAERGHIRRILFENIQTAPDHFNTLSLIGGYSPEHTAEEITFRNFRIGDKTVENPADLNLYTNEFVKDIRFEPPAD